MAAANRFEVKRFGSPRVMGFKRVVRAPQRKDARERYQGDFVVHTFKPDCS